jgi:hypothetical protein
VADRGSRRDPGRLALVETGLTAAFSGAASGVRTPLLGAAPRRARPPQNGQTPAEILMSLELTSRESLPEKGMAPGLAPTPSLGGSACERQAR